MEDYKGLGSKDNYTEGDLEDCLNLLIEAEKIENNFELMKLIGEYGKKKEGEIKSIQDIRDASNDMAEGKEKKKIKLPEALKAVKVDPAPQETTGKKLNLSVEFS